MGRQPYLLIALLSAHSSSEGMNVITTINALVTVNESK